MTTKREKIKCFKINKLKVYLISMTNILAVFYWLQLKKKQKINLTTRFLNGKMLMLSKISVKSFVYDFIDVFMFPNYETLIMTNIKL